MSIISTLCLKTGSLQENFNVVGSVSGILEELETLFSVTRLSTGDSREGQEERMYTRTFISMFYETKGDEDMF